MDQVEPGDGYTANSDTPVSETNWSLVLNKINLFPILLKQPEAITSQDQFAAWLFAVLDERRGLENQAWMDADDMLEHPWLNIMYQNLDCETEVSRRLLSCRSDNVGVQVACCSFTPTSPA